MRLATELRPAAIQDPHVLTDPNFPYWDENAAKKTPEICLKKLQEAGRDSQKSLLHIIFIGIRVSNAQIRMQPTKHSDHFCKVASGLKFPKISATVIF